MYLYMNTLSLRETTYFLFNLYTIFLETSTLMFLPVSLFQPFSVVGISTLDSSLLILYKLSTTRLRYFLNSRAEAFRTFLYDETSLKQLWN